jgi:anti-anti-sigma regulatory factor
MQITRKQVGIILFAIQATAILLMLIGQITVVGIDNTAIIIGVAMLITCVLFIAYWRDWAHAGNANVLLMTLLVGLGTPEPFVTRMTAPITLTPLAVALILARPRWIIIASIGVLTIYSVRGGAANNYLNAYIGDLRSLGTFVFMTGSLFLSRLVADAAQRVAEREAQRADRARSEAEEKATILGHQATELTAQNAEQRRLIALVNVLEIPVVALEERVLFAPLVGRFDTRRFDALTKRLLDQVASQQAALVIMDISGIPEMDTSNADGLQRVVQALRLLGCEVILTGLSARIAQTLAIQYINLNGVATLRTPQDALALWRAKQ